MPRRFEAPAPQGYAFWNRRGFDQDYSEYYLDMELDTARRLAGGCECVNEHGAVSASAVYGRARPGCRLVHFRASRLLDADADPDAPASGRRLRLSAVCCLSGPTL